MPYGDIGVTHEQGTGSGSCSWNNSNEMRCVSRTSTQLNWRSSHVAPQGAMRDWSDSANSKLHSVSHAIGPYTSGPSIAQVRRLSEYSNAERARAEQEKGVFPKSRNSPNLTS